MEPLSNMFKMKVKKKDASFVPYELHYHYLLEFLESSLYSGNDID